MQLGTYPDGMSSYGDQFFVIKQLPATKRRAVNYDVIWSRDLMAEHILIC